MARSTKRNRSFGGSLAEFGPTMWLFLVFIVIPLLDLISFASGVGTTMLLSTWSVRQAASCNTFTEAKASVLKTEDQLASFRKFAMMAPTGGGTTGVAVRVLVTPIAGGNSTTYSNPDGTIPNKPPDDPNLNPNIPINNTMNCVYQYVVTASYDVAPLFNFSGTPFLNGVPALGRPVPIVFTSTASVEHPEGLNQ